MRNLEKYQSQIEAARASGWDFGSDARAWVVYLHAVEAIDDAERVKVLDQIARPALIAKEAKTDDRVAVFALKDGTLGAFDGLKMDTDL